MFATLVALGLLAAAAPAAPADSTVRHKIVLELEPVVVVGGRMHDRGSIETAQPISPAALRLLPADRFGDVIALQPGVVATGSDLHVRGGRSGELAVSVFGITLQDPLRGSAPELPLFAVDAADLLTGGLGAEHAGSLAGELDVQPVTPTAAPAWRLRYLSDGRSGTGFDAVNAGATGPLGPSGLGYALALGGTFDDLGLPVTRSRGRASVLGQSFGWRQDNRMQGWASLAPVAAPGRGSLQVFGSRTVLQPYDPMFSYDGWVTPYPDTGRMIAAPVPLNWSSYRYRAADHLAMSEERRLAAVLSFAGGSERSRQRAAFGWQRASSLTSVGLRRDHDYLGGVNVPVWGPYDYAYADPFHIYGGDDTFWQSTSSVRWQARGELTRTPARNQRLIVGAGATYDDVRLEQYDAAQPREAGLDTARNFRAWAPGGYAYVQHRWEYEGLIWNAGLRAQAFTAGGPAPMHWTLSPRIGFAYPTSDRDVFALAYTRIAQDPLRDYLYDNRYVNYDRAPHGNPDLVPGEVVSWQASLRHVLDPEWSLQASVFGRDLYGQIGTRMVTLRPNVWRLEYTSDDVGHASGFDVMVMRELPGRLRFEVAYTFMTAYGTQSSEEGLAFGPVFGERPDPIGEHPLDWDIRHALSVSGEWHAPRNLIVSWGVRVASGRPWTPVYRDTLTSLWPPPYADQSEVNSQRLGMSERTNLAVRWRPRALRGATVLFEAANLFDDRADVLATISGYPNPEIGTIYDEYATYRTETGADGGAYWNADSRGAARYWHPLHDPRLRGAPRSLRLGFELSH